MGWKAYSKSRHMMKSNLPKRKRCIMVAMESRCGIKKLKKKYLKTNFKCTMFLTDYKPNTKLPK